MNHISHSGNTETNNLGIRLVHIVRRRWRRKERNCTQATRGPNLKGLSVRIGLLHSDRELQPERGAAGDDQILRQLRGSLTTGTSRRGRHEALIVYVRAQIQFCMNIA